MEQTIGSLSAEWAQDNEKRRDWVRGHYVEAAQHKYDTLDGKLRILQSIIDNKWIEPTETWKLRSLGIAFGDALQHKFPFEWVVVTDEYGTTPALRYPGSTLLLFVLTAISKRVERGDKVDILELFSGFCDMTIERLAVEGINPRPN